MKSLKDPKVRQAISDAVGSAEVALCEVFNNGHDSEITKSFLFQLGTAIESLLMGRPVVIPRDHEFGPLPRLLEDAPLGVVHPDAKLLGTTPDADTVRLPTHRVN